MVDFHLPKIENPIITPTILHLHYWLLAFTGGHYWKTGNQWINADKVNKQ